MNECTRAFSDDAAIHATREDSEPPRTLTSKWTKPTKKVGGKIQMSSSCPVGRKGNRRRLVGSNRHLEGEVCRKGDGRALGCVHFLQEEDPWGSP